MTTSLVARPGRWALPPQPPETWVGGAGSILLLAAAAAGVAVPGLVLLPDADAATAALAAVYAVGSLASVSLVYLLMVQASVTQDRRLAWAAGGFGLMWLLYLLRSLDPAVPGRAASDVDLRIAAALSLCWLLVLPATSATATLRRFGLGLLVVPLVLVAGSAVLGYALDLVDLEQVRVTSTGRAVFAGAAVLGEAAALWWRARVPDANKGAWGWVGAALLLTPVVGVLRAFSEEAHDPLAWPALLLEVAIVLLPALGLYALSARGYLRQARRWHQLEVEVRQLRASSALLPGLSVTPEDERGLPERVEVEDLLERADMQVALQPVLDLATGKAVGQEALARFSGRVPTDRWFRASVIHGFGAELERLTLARALSTLEALPPDQFLAINTSPASLHDEEVVRLLNATDLSRLIVEITEHDAVNDYEVTRQALAHLRRAGARIAVDDVGAGFASLRHVLLLQPDVVKLDTSLTRDVHHSPRQQAIVRALVTFSDEVGAVVLAEGIEVSEQVPALVEAGVTLGQGWHLGVPVMTPLRTPAS